MHHRDAHDLTVVAHVHSVFSDGTGTVTEIVGAAARSGADAVLLTDHDTIKARRPKGFANRREGISGVVDPATRREP